MNSLTKNKLLVWLIAVLLVANAATLVVFWMGRNKLVRPEKGSAQDFLITQLKLDTTQQRQLEALVNEHRQAVEELREKVKNAKDNLFELIKNPAASDSSKQAAAAAASRFTEQIDILTVNHFQKVRAICTPEQQTKFDGIIRDIMRMMGPPRLPEGPPNGQPPRGPGDHRSPPPPGE